MPEGHQPPRLFEGLLGKRPFDLEPVEGATVTLGFAPINGTVFKIIDNSGTADAVTGTFNGTPFTFTTDMGAEQEFVIYWSPTTALGTYFDVEAKTWTAFEAGKADPYAHIPAKAMARAARTFHR